MSVFAGLENCLYLFTRQYMIHKPPFPGRLEVKAMVKIMRLMGLSVDQQILLEENNPSPHRHESVCGGDSFNAPAPELASCCTGGSPERGRGDGRERRGK